jgi:exportin-2 (importin alpha re-exporter)
MYKDLFKDEQALKQICENVIIPQLRMREADEELFALNGQEYVRQDMEGSDVDTRKRTASDFVRGLLMHFEVQVSALLKHHVGVLLQQYAANPSKNWKSKNIAMYIVLALTIKGQTKAQGATSLNELVDIMSFFQTQVIPELQDKDIDNNAVIKADCLKFITMFRKQLPKDSYSALLGLIIPFLKR